ncbi:MAG: DNA-protecting protein DprA [Alphaproteobacteria bacterium]|nr:DNA-protecting protein DprA [Alphaproteobacteria bacterium]
MDHFGSAHDAIAGLPELAGRAAGKKLVVPDAGTADAELAQLAACGARLITLGEPDYPVSLAQIDDAPPTLAVRGDVSILSDPGIGIVGARNASTNGQRLAETMARDLADTGLSIVSGLARGIDTAAHHGALVAHGKTVAVMAGGVDIVYPPENQALYERVAEQGAVVSEMPPGLKPQARHFPRRNRIVSGLSLGVVIVEAAQRSGSLITARMAGEQGRDVLAVPGSPLDPRSYGANRLIREGATLVRDASDVLELIHPMLERSVSVPEHPDTVPRQPRLELESDNEKARHSIAECLSPEPVAVDEIVRRCQLTAPVVRTILLELELAGRLERLPGNRVAAL